MNNIDIDVQNELINILHEEVCIVKLEDENPGFKLRYKHIKHVRSMREELDRQDRFPITYDKLVNESYNGWSIGGVLVKENDIISLRGTYRGYTTIRKIVVYNTSHNDGKFTIETPTIPYTSFFGDDLEALFIGVNNDT